MSNSNMLEIIQGLAQAAANAWNGSHDGRFTIDEEENFQQEQRIEKLEKLKKPIKRSVWVAVGAALGVGTTIAIANAVN